MLRIHQFGSLEVRLTAIQIFGIYGENQPKTNLKHAAQNNKLSAVHYIQLKSTERLN